VAVVAGAGLLAGVLIGGTAGCRRSSPGAAPGAPQPAVEYFCPMHPQIVRDAPGDCPVCGMRLEKRPRGAGSPAASAGRRLLYYRHPMNPAVHSQTPAKDDMGMDYVPVYDDEVPAPGSHVAGRALVALPPERARLLGIRSQVVVEAGAGGALRTVGRVAVDERRREVVHAKYEGYIESLHVDFTGATVAKGQPLLAIYSPELVAAQQEYLLARRAQGELAGSAVPGVAQGGAELAEASRQRLRYFDMTGAEIEALERSGQPRRTVTVRSPLGGVVVQKLAVQGAKVTPADRLYEIADLSRVWVLADVYEKDLAAVPLGTPARVSLPYQPGREWQGVVAFVSPVVKADTRTVEVRLEVPNADGALKPDMFADVLAQRRGPPRAVVPESAVIFTGERTLVFVEQGEARYEPRELSLGARVPGGYQVLGGVTPGERVVVSANFLLDSESSLRAAIAASAPSPTPERGH
jgi:RND family efflux transporter MFP subunit